MVARLGGDEFCVFCSGLDQKNVESITQRLKDFLNSQTTKDYTIEFSLGTIQYQHGQHNTLEDMLAQADSSMYNDKKNKNTCKIEQIKQVDNT